MKIQEIYDGELYGTSYRTVYRETETGRFRSQGQLPLPNCGREGAEFAVKTTFPWKAAVERVVGQFPTVNVWRTSGGNLIGSAVRWLFVSTDGGQSWRVTRRLPASSGPMGVLPTAFCEHEGQLYVGEYPLDDDATPKVLRSDDGGHTWDPVLALPEVRHVHAIEPDPYSGDVWMTTGDVDEECRIGRLWDGEFDVVGSGGQHWRAVEPIFAPEGVLWGVDSVYTESNPIFLLRREDIERSDPEPTRLTSAGSSVYYGASLTVDGEHWALFSTAVEPGVDSTAPPDRQVVRTGQATVMAASSASSYQRWFDVAAFDKRSVFADVERVADVVPSAQAYVFLAASDDRGLFINPYNTDRYDGEVLNYSPGFFETLG